jgi:hypothetical protein
VRGEDGVTLTRQDVLVDLRYGSVVIDDEHSR